MVRARAPRLFASSCAHLGPHAAVAGLPAARAEAVEEWRQAETARKKQRLLRRTAAASGTIVAKAGGEAGSDSEDDEAGSGGGAAPVSQFKVGPSELLPVCLPREC